MQQWGSAFVAIFTESAEGFAAGGVLSVCFYIDSFQFLLTTFLASILLNTCVMAIMTFIAFSSSVYQLQCSTVLFQSFFFLPFLLYKVATIILKQHMQQLTLHWMAHERIRLRG